MPDAVELSLWVAAAYGCLWAFGPPLLDLFQLGGLSYAARDDADLALPGEDDPEYAAAFRELCELGFRPAGAIDESMRFLCGEWSKHFHVRLLTTPDLKCHAACYRLTPGEGLRVNLTSFTASGALVRTVTPGAGLSVIDEAYARIEVERQPLSDLLARHLEHVGHYCRQYFTDVVPATLAEHAAIDQAHEERVLRRNVGLGGLNALPFGVIFMPTALFVWAAPKFGMAAEEPSTWAAALCVGTGVYFVFRRVVVQALFRGECLRTNPPKRMGLRPRTAFCR